MGILLWAGVLGGDVTVGRCPGWGCYCERVSWVGILVWAGVLGGDVTVSGCPG